MAAVELEFVSDVADLDLRPARLVVEQLNLAAETLKLPEGKINVALVEDAQMRTLNKEYAGHDYATDVLSFSYLESGGPIDGVIGEMVISLETAQRQAVEAGNSLADELALLVAHGVLHIAGYDHQTVPAQKELGLIQEQLLTAAGCRTREFKWQS